METVRLSRTEAKRLELMGMVKGGKLTLKKASEFCGVCYRQMQRIWARYLKEGPSGLAHKSRGKGSNRRKAESIREQALEGYRTRYVDFGPTLASEELAKEGLVVDHETLRRWLLESGLWKKKRKRQKHRQWRARRGHCGELIQMDGSHHDWFEGRGEYAVLMVMIDDATNRTYARLYPGEDTRAAMDVFGRYARRYGLPQRLYVDHDSIYESSRESRIDEELRGEGPKTQFGRAMERLGVDILPANSPQAKGRVERRHGVFQDRLVKGMRLAGISTIEAANEHLEKVFLLEMNRRFRQKAREAGDLHRKIPRGIRLKDVLCFEEQRVVQNDWTVRWRNRFFQISSRHEGLHLARRKVTVREHLDGKVVLVYRGDCLCFKELSQKPPPKVLRSDSFTPRKRSVPAADHPWRKPLKNEQRGRKRAVGRKALPAPPSGPSSRAKR